MKRKFFVVGNPSSRPKSLEIILRELLDYFASKGYKYEVFLTALSKNAWKTVDKHLDESFTDLLIIGGDGTINESVNGLKHDVPVSIIPNGTGNDFVKMLNIGATLEDHIQVLDHGVIQKVDLGVCNGRKFVNGVGVGFDGQIIADMQNKKTNLLTGRARYYYFVLRILANYRSRRYQFTKDNNAGQKDMILFCVANGTTFGGSFKLTPDAKIDDGLLSTCEIGRVNLFKRFINIYRLIRGSHSALREVTLSSCEKVTIAENPKLHAHIDGEYFGQPPFEFSILPKALSVRVKE